MAKKSMVAKQKRKDKITQQENIAVAESADVHMHI